MNWSSTTSNGTNGGTIFFQYTWQMPPPPPPPVQQVNAYDVLGIPRGSDAAICRRAYRKLAKLYHPDITGDADDKMKLLNRAFTLLKEQGLA